MHSIRIRCFLFFTLGLLATAPPSSARITRSRPSPSAAPGTPEGVSRLLAPLYSLVIGSGFEYETDDEQTEYGFPILIEYNFSERLKLSLEPQFTSIVGKTADVRSVSGFSDLETLLDYEFLRERRYRPALSVEGGIRWPTAADPELGEPGRDYTLGLIASKDLVFVEVDLNVLYTFVGDRDEKDEVEVALAAGWRVNRYVEIITEVANVTRLGSFRSGTRNETEATVGIGWQVNDYLKFEQGVVFKEHGVWQAVFAWEWSFGGD